MFWFKRKKLVVDAFTDISIVNELFPIAPIREHRPDWWKKLPNTYITHTDVGLDIESSTIKKCDGLLAAYSRGFVIPMWSDFLIETTEDGQFKYHFAAILDRTLNEHHKDQMGPAFDHLIHFKLLSPWLLAEKTGIEFYWAQPFWNQLNYLKDFYIPPAVISYDHQSGTELNVFMPRIKNKVIIPAGQPMVHLIPLTEHDVEVRTHLVTKAEMNAKSAAQNKIFKFFDNYKIKKILREKKPAKSKCPFGFGRK